VDAELLGFGESLSGNAETNGFAVDIYQVNLFVRLDESRQVKIVAVSRAQDAQAPA
jgi:hypothetical protein